MPKMYKKGSEAVVVHPSQVHNAEARGWSLKNPDQETKTKPNKSKGVKNGNT